MLAETNRPLLIGLKRPMVVFARQVRQSVVVGRHGGLRRFFRVTVVEIRTDSVLLGFEVDPEVPILRTEVSDRLECLGANWGPYELTPELPFSEELGPVWRQHHRPNNPSRPARRAIVVSPSPGRDAQ